MRMTAFSCRRVVLVMSISQLPVQAEALAPGKMPFSKYVINYMWHLQIEGSEMLGKTPKKKSDYLRGTPKMYRNLQIPPPPTPPCHE